MMSLSLFGVCFWDDVLSIHNTGLSIPEEGPSIVLPELQSFFSF